jgi:hypothetical protein
MKDAQCSNCCWFEVFRNPETGRKNPSKPGVCGYPLPWPTVWPACIQYPPYRPSMRTWPLAGHNCGTFEQKP